MTRQVVRDRTHHLKNSKGAAWRKQEEKLARDHGIRRNPGSGAGIDKGDVQGRTFKIECKYTKLDDFRLQARVLEKIDREAQAIDSLPLVQIQLNEKCKVAIMRRSDFTAFREHFEGKVHEQILSEDRRIDSYSISVALMLIEFKEKILVRHIPIGGKAEGKMGYWTIIPWKYFVELMGLCSISL